MALPARGYVVYRPSGRIATKSNGQKVYWRKMDAFKRAKGINGYVVSAEFGIWTKIYDETEEPTSLESATGYDSHPA